MIKFNLTRGILMVCSMMIFTIPMLAQKETIKVGFSINKYAFNRFNFEVKDSTSINGSGFTVGFAYEKPIGKHTTLLMGFGFSQRNNEVLHFYEPNFHRTHWASFPLTINYYLIKNLALEAGCQFEHLVFKQKFGEYSDSLQQKSGYTKYDLGLIAGLRLNFRKVELIGSFNYGLKNIYNIYGFYPAKGIYVNATAKSYSIKIGLNYLFQ